MYPKIEKSETMAIIDILQSANTLEKIEKFKLYLRENIIRDCRIFLFDEECSNFDDSLKNRKIGQCAIIGAGDYTKTWILDSHHISDKVLIEVGKTIDFDLNILTYLNKIVVGRKINIDRVEFLKYLNFLKKEQFQIGIPTALMERVQTPLDLNILFEMITSFVKFDNVPSINGDLNDICLSSDDYKRVQQIYDISLNQKQEKLEQLDLICCCVMKAFLIKEYETKLSTSEKVEKLISYCLNVLNCYLEKEIVMLSLYLMDDDSTHKTFQKLKNNADIIKNISNISWDILHIRLVEQIMLCDNMKNTKKVILSYYATADNGIIDAMQINPIKAFVIIHNCCISFHKMNIADVCQNEEVLKNAYWNAGAREQMRKKIDFKKIKQELESEILANVRSVVEI